MQAFMKLEVDWWLINDRECEAMLQMLFSIPYDNDKKTAFVQNVLHVDWK